MTDNTWELWFLITCALIFALWLAAEAIVWVLTAIEERRPPPMTDERPGMWRCTECDWRGRTPSWTDASTEVERDGRLIIDRTHVPLCPRCFERATTCRT